MSTAWLVGPVAAGLMALVPLAPADAAPADTPPAPAEWGSVQGAGGSLQKGCAKYTYTYALTPPEGIWQLEVFITGPDGQAVASGDHLYGYDPLNGSDTYQVCTATTPPGTFTITARLTVHNGPAEPGTDFDVQGMLAPSTYVLTKAPRVPRHRHKHRHKHKHKHRHRHHHRPHHR